MAQDERVWASGLKKERETKDTVRVVIILCVVCGGGLVYWVKVGGERM